jgi:hypothetical protein
MSRIVIVILIYHHRKPVDLKNWNQWRLFIRQMEAILNEVRSKISVKVSDKANMTYLWYCPASLLLVLVLFWPLYVRHRVQLLSTGPANCVGTFPLNRSGFQNCIQNLKPVGSIQTTACPVYWSKCNVVSQLKCHVCLQLESFLKVRLCEMRGPSDLLMLSQLQAGPPVIQLQTAQSVSAMLNQVQAAISEITDSRTQHLHNIKNSPR